MSHIIGGGSGGGDGDGDDVEPESGMPVSGSGTTSESFRQCSLDGVSSNIRKLSRPATAAGLSDGDAIGGGGGTGDVLDTEDEIGRPASSGSRTSLERASIIFDAPFRAPV